MANSTTPPPSFPVETKTDSLEVFTKKVKTLILKKIGTIPQETLPNCMSVDTTDRDENKFCYYIPHNYRLYFDFNTKSFNKLPLYKDQAPELWGYSTVLGTLKTQNLTNHNSTNIFKFQNATIWVRKQSVTICNKIDHKKSFQIPINTNADKIIKEIITIKDNECKLILSEFIKIYGGSSSFQIFNRHSEDKIFNEDSINCIGIKAKFNNEVGKKVYNEHNFEFSNPAYASNYIINRSIENIAPNIASELKANREILNYIININRSTSELLKNFTFFITNNQLKEDTEINKQKHLFDYIN